MAAVLACGGAKRVGAAIRPEIVPDEAGKWLMSALNPARKERLSPEQIERIMRMAMVMGNHDPINRLTDALGYYRTQPVDREAQRRVIQEQIRRHQQQLDHLEHLPDFRPSEFGGGDL